MAPLLARLGLGRSGFGFSKRTVSGAAGITATGGNQTPNAGLAPGNGYKYHTFTSPGNFAVSSGSANMDILLVAGGGGGGAGYYTGGGGAGGVVYGPTIPIIPGTYPVVVGPGGSGGTPFAGTAENGTPSSFDIVTAIGGGGGGSGPGGPPGRSGGSAGGSGYYSGPPSGVTPQPVPGLYTAYGNDAPWSPSIGNGGGGAGGAGGSANSPSRQAGSGQPFPGFEYPIVGLTPVAPVANSPTNNHYGGGGSGGMPGSNIVGGAGGGGYGTTGGSNPSPTITANAASNTGGGGGGRGNPNGPGGSGGSGVVIIRYQV